MTASAGRTASSRTAHPLRIVHVLSSLGMGGQERVALDIACAQRETGHEVAVISMAPVRGAPLTHHFEAGGVAVHELVKRSTGLDVTLPGRFVRALLRLGPHIVHTHNPLPLIYAAPAARLVGAAVIHSKHGRNPGTGRFLWLRRQAARCVASFVAVSAATADQAREQRDCAPGKLRVIPNGIDLRRFCPRADERAAVRRGLGISESAWVVGTVGRLDPNKNQALLIDAAAPLLGPEFHVVIAGDGESRSALEARVAALPHPASVHLLGRRDDVAAILAALDVFVLTSHSEGLPLVLPEAMASGVPPVCTRVGGIPEVVEPERTGLLFEAGDGAGLRGHLTRLAEDRELARALGGAARDVALDRFSLARMVDAYLELYRGALAARGTAARGGLGGG